MTVKWTPSEVAALLRISDDPLHLVAADMLEARQAALCDAIGMLQEWGAYVDDYFKHKHGFTSDIERLKELAK